MRSMNPSQLKDYQRRAGLVADGICGPVTRSALLADEVGRLEPRLADFRGSLGLIIQLEGFKGRPYWPGGRSGVTLDYGYDLGSHSPDDLRKHYGELWPAAEVNTLATACHLGGPHAEEWLRQHDAFRWPMLREQAAEILPAIAGPYWEGAKWAWKGATAAPPQAQTVALSLVYNGWLHPLRVILPKLERQQWTAAAEILRGMEPRGRRAVEAGLLESLNG